MFENRIKQNFLIEIKEMIKKELGMDLFKYFYISYSMNSIVNRVQDTSFDFELCRMIVGCHRANTIFMEDSE